jgi:hypothetical protein
MTKQQQIDLTAPAGTSGMAVAPWDPSEIYAVAANWAQASAPVWTYGLDGWTMDSHGRQVADFRHDSREALESEIREAMIAGGSGEDDDEVAAIMSFAVEIGSAD